MTTLQWYKRYPLAYLDGTRRLSLEERGAYADLLELIMYHGGSVDDDCKYLAAEMHCDIRVWRRIRIRLLVAGKIYTENGKIHNKRADKEAHEAIARMEATSQLNASKGRKSGEVRSRYNGLGEPAVAQNKKEIKIEESIKDSPPYGPPNGVDKVAPDGAPAAHAARDGRGQFSFMADDHSLESKAAAKPPKPSSKELDAAFEAFWSEVPTGRKFGKEACRRKVRRIISSGRCSPGDLLTKMHEYARGCETAGIEKSSIKLPETWLNKECYLDEEQFIPKAQQLSRFVDMCPKDAETGLRYVSKTTKMFLDMADYDRLHKGERLRVGL